MASSSHHYSGSNIGRTGEDIKERAKDTASKASDKAQDLTSQAVQGVKDAASNVAERAQNAASAATNRMRDVASNVSDKTDDAISSVGERMSSLAGSLRDSAPQGGTLGTAAEAVAGRLEAGGHYLQEHGIGEMTDDVASLIRQYPLQSLLVGFGVGCLVGMTCTRR
jgi:ElaB/YqjD/DUF883 family membrane-anchored ribosome-binding protein